MFERCELAVRLESLDRLFHPLRTSAEVRRAHNDDRVLKPWAVFEELRLEDVICLVLRRAKLRVGRIRREKFRLGHLADELRLERMPRSFRVGLEPQFLDCRESLRVKLVAVLHRVVVYAVPLDPSKLLLLVRAD